LSFGVLVFLIIGSTLMLRENRQSQHELEPNFDQSSGIKFSTLSEQKIEDLAKLAKVWGFVKYHHPKVVAGELNWDHELFHVMQKILEDRSDVNVILYEWVHNLDQDIAARELEEPDPFPEESIQLHPTTDWVHDEELLGSDLSRELSNLLTTHITNRENAYVHVKDDGYFDMKNEKVHYQMQFDDTGYRLLGLFRYWNIIEYYYPYKDLSEIEWNQVLQQFIPKMIEGNDYDSYFMTAAELTAVINDSHVWLKGEKGKGVSDYFGEYQIPVSFVKIDNQIVISKVFNECGLEVGDIVLKVDGIDIEEIAENRKTYISKSREETFPVFYQALFRTHQKNASTTVIREGNEITVNTSSKRYRVGGSSVDTESQAMEKGEIYYINAGLLQEGQIDEIMQEHWNTKGLIVDLRTYPSTNFSDSLAKYLISSPKEFTIMSFPNSAKPGEFDYEDPFVSGGSEDGKSGIYKGKVVVLINEHTISHGEFITLLLRKADHSIVLGRPTAGANGNVVQFYLPGNILTRISGLGVFDPEKGRTQGIGVHPDIYLNPTVDGIVQGRDEYIEKAVELIKNDNPLNAN